MLILVFIQYPFMSGSENGKPYMHTPYRLWIYGLVLRKSLNFKNKIMAWDTVKQM